MYTLDFYVGKYPIKTKTSRGIVAGYIKEEKELEKFFVKEGKIKKVQKESHSIDDAIRHDFILTSEFLFLYRPLEYATILNFVRAGSPLYFINAHGCEYKGKWVYRDEKLVPVETELKTIRKGAVVLWICNEAKNKVRRTNVPLLYTQGIVAKSRINDGNLRVILPKTAKQEIDYCRVGCDFLDALFQLQIKSNLPSQLVENLKIIYERNKEILANSAKHSQCKVYEVSNS